MNLVFLPATEPGDQSYGSVPRHIATCQDAVIREVRFPNMVWYNEAVRGEAIEQIRAFGVAPVTLVGFSKSGLGAWNIVRTIPELVACTIIFDAPMARLEVPPWNTRLFYPNDQSWQADLPLLTIKPYEGAVPASHRLILISGATFHDEMVTFSQALAEAKVEHAFLPRPNLKHHWNSGWLEEALALVS